MCWPSIAACALSPSAFQETNNCSMAGVVTRGRSPTLNHTRNLNWVLCVAVWHAMADGLDLSKS